MESADRMHLLQLFTMGGKKLTAKSIKRKNAPTHPNSRRAHQLQRVALRDDKLAKQKHARKTITEIKIERMLNLIGLLDPALDRIPDLPSLHTFISESYLALNQERLAQLQAERRPGRPPSQKEVQLQDLVAREKEEYRTGMEVPDLLNETNVRLLRNWQGNPQELPLFRIVRIAQAMPDQFKISQEGKHKELQPEFQRADVFMNM